MQKQRTGVIVHAKVLNKRYVYRGWRAWRTSAHGNERSKVPQKHWFAQWFLIEKSRHALPITLIKHVVYEDFWRYHPIGNPYRKSL